MENSLNLVPSTVDITNSLQETTIDEQVAPSTNATIVVEHPSFKSEEGEIFSYTGRTFVQDGLTYHQYVGDHGTLYDILEETKFVTDQLENVINQTIQTAETDKTTTNQLIQQETHLPENNDFLTSEESKIEESKSVHPSIVNESSQNEKPETMLTASEPTTEENSSCLKSSKTQESSPKANNRTNIVWLNFMNQESSNENKVQEKRLTTTIEIATDDALVDRLQSPKKNHIMPKNASSLFNSTSMSRMPENVKINLSSKNEQSIKLNYKKAPQKSIEISHGNSLSQMNGNSKVETANPESNLKTYTRQPFHKKFKNTILIKEDKKLIKAAEPDKNAIIKKNDPTQKIVEKQIRQKDSLILKTKSSDNHKITNSTSPKQQILIETDFRKNDTRTKKDFNDYRRKNMIVSVRIQPNARNELMSTTIFGCISCDFSTKFLNLFKYHQKSCNKSKNKPFFNNETPSSNLSVIRKRKSIANNDTIVEEKNYNNQRDSITINKIKNVCSTFNDEDEEIDDDDDENESITKPSKRSRLGLDIGDVVWAKTKIGLWPALVHDILDNEKELMLKLLFYPFENDSLKVFLKSVILFGAPDRQIELINKSLSKVKDVHKDKLLKSIQQAESVLRKRALDNNVDLIETVRLPPSVPTDLHSKAKNLSSLDPAVIMKLIKDGQVDTHLIAIKKETFICSRHREFMLQNNKNENDKLNEEKKKNVFGPIKDEDQRDELFSYCNNLFKKEFDDSSFDLHSYIYCVWIPEVIIKAINKIYQIETQTLESLFVQKED